MTLTAEQVATLEQARDARHAAQETLEAAVRETYAAGGSLREIAEVVGVSHDTIRRIVRAG